MTIEERAAQAAKWKASGLGNCCQSVALALADQTTLSEDALMAACSGFAVGMGNMEGTCGALSGACVLAGMKNSGGDLEAPATKGATYQLSREIVRRFEAIAGATACKDLKGVETGEVLHPCPACITDAAKIVEDVLFPGVFE